MHLSYKLVLLFFLFGILVGIMFKCGGHPTEVYDTSPMLDKEVYLHFTTDGDYAVLNVDGVEHGYELSDLAGGYHRADLTAYKAQDKSDTVWFDIFVDELETKTIFEVIPDDEWLDKFNLDALTCRM